jgi:predicted transcriptional regulator
LILPCEVGVKTVLPAVKAIMARSIVENHKLTEKQTANLLSLSQSAVSRYVSRERGANLIILENTPEVVVLIEQMVTTLIKEPENRSRFLELFCTTCALVREKGLFCPKCGPERQLDWSENCFFCRRV